MSTPTTSTASPEPVVMRSALAGVIAHAYYSGEPWDALEARLGVTRSTVYKVLDAHGLPRTRPGGRPRRPASVQAIKPGRGRCGTLAGHEDHKAAGEKPCKECADVYAAWAKVYAERCAS